MQSEAQASNGIPSARRTVNEAIDDYVALRRKDTVTVGTIEDIEWATRIVASELGSTKLFSLSVADCDRLLEVCADGRSKSLSKPRLTRLRRSLVRVLDNEIRLGRLSRNVATLSVVPAGNVTDTERRSLTHEELQSMLDHAKHSRLILIDLCGRNGLRPAEARGLRWKDLSLDAEELSVRGQQDRMNSRTGVKGLTALLVLYSLIESQLTD